MEQDKVVCRSNMFLSPCITQGCTEMWKQSSMLSQNSALAERSHYALESFSHSREPTRHWIGGYMKSRLVLQVMVETWSSNIPY